MLEMLRDKRLMFVGDSIQRGMFDSMVCLVQSVISDGDHSLKRVPPRKIFRIEVFINYFFEFFSAFSSYTIIFYAFDRPEKVWPKLAKSVNFD